MKEVLEGYMKEWKDQEMDLKNLNKNTVLIIITLLNHLHNILINKELEPKEAILEMELITSMTIFELVKEINSKEEQNIEENIQNIQIQIDKIKLKILKFENTEKIENQPIERNISMQVDQDNKDIPKTPITISEAENFIFGNDISKNKIKRKVNQEVGKRTYRKIEYSKENVQTLEIVWENIKQIDRYYQKTYKNKEKFKWQYYENNTPYKTNQSRI